MTKEDADRWDQRWAAIDPSTTRPQWPALFADHIDLVPRNGRALDVACGTGTAAVWLALRGLQVEAVDVSAVAVSEAVDLARQHRVADRCESNVHDLDEGLPAGEAVDLVLCHLFRDRSLDAALIDRLVPGGLLFVAVLSEVGASPGPYRAEPGELLRAFSALDIIDHGEADGCAWLIGRTPM